MNQVRKWKVESRAGFAAGTPVIDLLEPRLLLGAHGLHADAPSPEPLGGSAIVGRVVEYVTIPSVKSADGKTFASGGVYRSVDRGETWQWAMGAGINTTIGLHSYGESDIDQYWFLSQAEDHPNTIYVTNRGTGFWPPYQYTVYRSDNSGDAWRWTFFNDSRTAPDGKNYCNTELGWQFYALGSGFGGPPWGFTVNPANPEQALYTNGGEIFITTNGGTTWKQAYSLYPPGQSAPTTSNPGRWQTTGIDVTSSWNYLFDPFDSNRTYICTTDIGFARSTDRGATWYSANSGINWSNTVYQAAFDPTVPGKMWAACSNQHDIPHWTNIAGATGTGGVAISTNYGQTWTSVTSGGLPSAPVTAIVVDPTSSASSRTLWAAVYGSGVYKSTNGGTTWVNKSSGITPTNNLQACALKRAPDGTLYCAVAARRIGNGVTSNTTGGIFKSTNGGDTWTKISSSAIFWPEDVTIDTGDTTGKTLYVAAADGFGYSGGVYKTTNGGTSWTRTVPSGISGSLEGYSVAINPQNRNILYFTTISHGMFISTDAGATWAATTAANSPPFQWTQHLVWDPQDVHTVYLTTFGGGVWKGPDPAFAPVTTQTWTPVGMGGGGALFYPSVSPLDPNLMFVSCDMSGMYRSADGGQTWTMLDWRNQQQSATPIFHPTNPNVVYTLPFQNSGDRLEISTDKGLTWSLVGGANPVWKGDNLLSFTIDRGNPSLCLLAGQNGLYRSTTGGSTWAKVSGAPGGLIGVSVDQTSPVASRVVLASTSSAPWRSDDGGLTWAQKSSGLPAGATIRAFSAGSDPAPAVVVGAVNGGDVQRSQITSVAFQFSENVSAAVTVGDLTLRNDTTGTAVNLSGLTSSNLTYDAGTNTATWSLSGLNLPDGNYTATLPAASVTDFSGSALTGAGTVGFHRLLCDANGDRKVDGGDLALWQQNYDPLKVHQDTPGMGDWNGDGKIDGGDLALWQQHYNAIGLSAEGPAQPSRFIGTETQGVATPAALAKRGAHADKVIGRHAKPADVNPAEPAVTLDSLLQPIRLRDSGCPRH